MNKWVLFLYGTLDNTHGSSGTTMLVVGLLFFMSNGCCLGDSGTCVCSLLDDVIHKNAIKLGYNDLLGIFENSLLKPNM